MERLRTGKKLEKRYSNYSRIAEAGSEPDHRLNRSLEILISNGMHSYKIPMVQSAKLLPMMQTRLGIFRTD